MRGKEQIYAVEQFLYKTGAADDYSSIPIFPEKDTEFELEAKISPWAYAYYDGAQSGRRPRPQRETVTKARGEECP